MIWENLLRAICWPNDWQQCQHNISEICRSFAERLLLYVDVICYMLLMVHTSGEFCEYEPCIEFPHQHIELSINKKQFALFGLFLLLLIFSHAWHLSFTSWHWKVRGSPEHLRIQPLRSTNVQNPFNLDKWQIQINFKVTTVNPKFPLFIFDEAVFDYKGFTHSHISSSTCICLTLKSLSSLNKFTWVWYGWLWQYFSASYLQKIIY